MTPLDVLILNLAKACIAEDPMAMSSLGVRLKRAAGDGSLSQADQPETHDAMLLAVAAALVEGYCDIANAPYPAWTAHIGRVEQQTFLFKRAAHVPHLRAHCEKAAPQSFLKRNLLVPSRYLSHL